MILNESKRDELLLPYLNIYKEKTGQNVPLGRFKEMMLYKLGVQGGLQNLSKSSNYYLVGATKYYFNGDLTTNSDLSIFHEDFNDDDNWDREICIRLNACINVLRDAYIDTVGTEFEQPEDFGTLTLQRLLRKYNKKINAALGIVEEPKTKKPKEAEPEEIDYNVGNGYTFDILYSYNDATKYNRWTQPGAWCITYGTSHYNGYIRRLGIHYVIFLKNGYQQIERPTTPGPGFTQQKPHDEYGNSMIAMLQSNDSWQPIYITSRWNHGAGNVYCEADHAYTLEEFCQITGVTTEDLERIYEIWKRERTKKRPARQRTPDDPEVRARALAELRRIKYAQMRINGGENANTLFDVRGVIYGREGVMGNNGEYVYDFKNSVYVCSLKRTDEDDDDTPHPNGTTMFLVDKGKTVFETVCLLERVWWGDCGFISAEKFYNRNNPEDRCKMHNIVMFKKNDSAPWMLYDTRRHDFVDVEGVKKFKYLPLTWSSNNDERENAQFYVVKQTGTKQALIKISNNLPLRLPNGQFWFNRLRCDSNSRWSRYVNGKFVGTKSDVFLQLMIDHPENGGMDTYFYSVKRGRFVEMPDLRKIDKIFENCSMEIYSTLTLGGEKYNILRYNGGQLGYNGIKCLVDDDGRMQDIGGFTLFENFYSVGYDDDLVCVEPAARFTPNAPDWYHPDEQRGNMVVYSAKKNAYLTINGKFLYCGGVRTFNKSFIGPYQKDDTDITYIINTDTMTLLKNPIGYPSEYEFSVATYDSYPQLSLTMYKEPNTRGAYWWSSDPHDKQEFQRITMRIEPKNLTGIPIEFMGGLRPSEQQINESYIRRMVSEVLKKVLKDGK